MPRNPQVFGDGDSHSVYRYSIWHIHLLSLQSPFRNPFTADSDALLPRILPKQGAPAVSVQSLFPIIFGAGFLDQ